MTSGNDVGQEKSDWMVQALVVTQGPFKGRICENDDEEFMYRNEFQRDELAWIEIENPVWEHSKEEVVEEKQELISNELEVGLHCEIVTFGFYLHTRGYHVIPRQFLAPATTHDLVRRLQEISEMAGNVAWQQEPSYNFEELCDALLELEFIQNELWERDKAMLRKGNSKIFLCHSSADKPFVRTVGNDLVRLGHSIWLDEFEINVGDSIVDKIDEGNKNADALILFISENSQSSEWVKREWQSALSRQLSRDREIRIYPVLIDNCKIPAIINDVKFADFRESYHSGLDQLAAALAANSKELS